MKLYGVVYWLFCRSVVLFSSWFSWWFIFFLFWFFNFLHQSFWWGVAAIILFPVNVWMILLLYSEFDSWFLVLPKFISISLVFLKLWFPFLLLAFLPFGFAELTQFPSSVRLVVASVPFGYTGEMSTNLYQVINPVLNRFTTFHPSL